MSDSETVARWAKRFVNIHKVRFAAATQRLHQRFGGGERFNRQFAQLVFKHLGPPGLHFEDVAFRVIETTDDEYGAEMFVLGGGLVTVVVKGNSTEVIFNVGIRELEHAPSWVSGGDCYQ